MAGRLGLKSRSGSNEILGISSGYIPIRPAPRIARINSHQQDPSQSPGCRPPIVFGRVVAEGLIFATYNLSSTSPCEKSMDWHSMAISNKNIIASASNVVQQLSQMTSHCSVTFRACSISPFMAQNPCKAIAASRPKSSPSQLLSAAFRALLRSKHRSKYGIARCVKPKMWYACPTLNSASCFSDKLLDRCRLS